MKIIVENQEEIIEVARVLQRAAESVKLDMRLNDIEQDSMSIHLCKMRNSIIIKSSVWAFPNDGVNTFHGMTLRDYFAGQALMGIMVAADPIALLSEVSKEFAKDFARKAYLIADSMLAERNKE